MQIIGVILLWFAIAVGIACLASVAVMIGVGNIHAWWSFIPTMGFGDAFSVTVWFVVPLALYAGHSSSSRD